MNIDLTSATSLNNMSYLGLNGEQYLIHCKIMKNLSLAPEGMHRYCESQGAFCGDAFACWVADYVKANPKEVAHLR